MQKKKGIQLRVDYQFEESRLGTQIFWQLSKDFNIASWMEKYFEGNNKNKDDYFTIDIIDVRQLKRCKNSKEVYKNPWVFLIQDKKDDVRIKQCLSTKYDEQSLSRKDYGFNDILAKINSTKELLAKLQQLKNNYAKAKGSLQAEDSKLLKEKKEFDGRLSNIKGIRELLAKIKTAKKDDGKIKGNLQAEDKNKPLQVFEIPDDKQTWIKDIIKIAEQKQLYLYVLLWQAGVDQLNSFLTKENEHIIDTFDQLDVTFFLKKQQNGIHPYFIIKQRLLKSPVANLRCQWKEFIFDLSKRRLIQYKILQQGKIKDLTEQQLRQKQMRGIDNVNTIKALHIDMEVDRSVETVFGEPTDSTMKTIYYDTIQYNCTRNKFTYLKKNLILREGKKFSEQHYNLAFQGGGAKGFAYVGAYKALKQHKINGKEIPIKSIMGSSAGGIVAIAASTGISWRQIEAICYKMKDIPATDRIESEQQCIKHTDQFGNEISFQTLQHDFKHLFNQYGIMTELLSNVFFDFLKGDKFRNEIQQKLVKFLEIVNPSISQIFSIKTAQIITYPWYKPWKKDHKVQRFFNWSGLAFHGALMKGQAIHRIAAECIIRYFYKQIAGQREQKRFREEEIPKIQGWPDEKYKLYERLEDAFRDNPLIMNQKQGGDPMRKFQRFKGGITKLLSLGNVLFKAKIGELVPNRAELLQFLVYLINSTLFKLNILCSQTKKEGEQGSLNIGELKYSNLHDFFDFKKEIESKELYMDKLKKIKKNRERNLQIITSTKNSYSKTAQVQIKESQDNNLRKKEKDAISIQSVKIMAQLQRLQQNENKFIDIINQLIISLKDDNFLQYFKLQSIKRQIQQIQQEDIKVSNHNGRDQSSNQQNVRPFTKNLIGFQQKIKFLTNCRTYNEINSVSNTTNFINPSNLVLNGNEGIKELTVKQFLQKVFLQKKIEDPQTWQTAEYLTRNIEHLEIDKLIFDYLSVNHKPPGGPVQQYKKAYDQLVSACQTMTMKEYYALIGIELTCTSVDLDDHILRLFNHKTTPNLPVCRAIQMTGSFPVAFKAQRWRPEWGLYHVQKKGRMVSIDITGHQFTDGGLLANFPIKYFDNPYISYQYFDHSSEEGKTIILGFGLDMLQPGTYQHSEEEIEKAKMVDVQLAKAFKELQDSFPISLAQKIFTNSGWFNCNFNKVKLGELDRLIFQNIPLFRFLSKLVRAYPNADRNLNIQAFENRVFMQDMSDTNDSPTSQYLINSTTKEQQIVINEQIKWDLQNSFREFKKFKKALEIKNIEQPNRIDIDAWKKAIEDKLKGLETIYKERIANIKQGHRIYYQNPFHYQEQIEDPVKQQQMSRYLLKILRTTLRNYTPKESKSNKELNDVLSERYAYLKFIAEGKELQGTLTQKVTLNKKLKVMKELNQSTFRNLFDSYDLEEISKNLNFKNIKQEYNKAAKNQGLFAQDLCNPTKMTSQVKDRLFNGLNGKLKNQPHFFVDPYRFYVNQSLRRLTQYVFLQVKSKSPTYRNNIQKLNTIIRNTEFSQLISDKPSNNFEYLTFDEILDFMYELSTRGVQYAQNQFVKIDFQPRFLVYLNEIKKQPIDKNDQFLKNSNRIKATLKFDLLKLIEQKPIKDKNMLIPQIQETMKQLFQIPQVINFSNAVLKLTIKQNISTISQILQPKDEIQINDFLNFVLNGSTIKADKSDLSVFNEGYMKILQQKSLKTLKTLLFGQKYYNLKYNNTNFFRNKFQQLQKQIKQQKQNSSKGQDFDNIDNIVSKQKASFAPIQRTMMKYFYNKTIQKYIGYRMKNKQTQAFQKNTQSEKLIAFNKLYLSDLGYLLKFIRTLALLLINSMNIKDSQNHLQLPDHQPKYRELLKKLTECYFDIFDNFNDRYQLLSESSENQISLETINHAFLVKLKSINCLIKSLGQLKQLKPFDIDQTINNFIFKNFSLPLFNTDISNLLKYLNISYDSAIQRQAAKLNNPQQVNSITRNTPSIPKRQKTVTKTFDQEVRHMKNVYGDTSPQINLQLLLEGIGNSSDYYSSLFQFIKKFMKRELGWEDNKEKKQQIKLKKICCSGFHSIFGFLLTLGKDIEDIREDMYRIRQFAYQKFDGDKIKKFFKKQGHYTATENYASLSKSLTVQLSTVFQRFQTSIKQKPQKFNYQKCFNDIRLLIQQQQRYYTQSCNKILDESMLKIKNIQNKYIDPVQPKQIAKEFAFEYTCSFNQRHQYNKDLLKTKKIYLKIVEQIFDQFGDILSTVLCDTIASNSPLITQPEQIQQFTKGKLIGRMLTVYKLKAFIYEQLQAHGFPRNITLNEYFQRSKPENQILLTFLCVNVSEQRLQMLDKILTPKMPLWAAILASSSLPIIHRNFWSEREWEELQQSDKYHEVKRLQFFGNKASIQRKKTFYNSSIYISSLPIELISNATIFKQLATYDTTFTKTLGSLYFLAAAFNPKYSGNLSKKVITRKYMNITLGNIGIVVGKYIWNKVSAFIPFNNHDKRHFNKSYDTSFGVVSALLSGFKTNSALNTFGTLSEANDNFIMKWYFNRLIRLPIKFGTLDFGKIVDQKVYNKFNIQIPSSTAHETTLRSYHITKSFIHNIQHRPSPNIQRFNPAELLYPDDRYLVNIRASIITVPSSSSGYDKDYYSIVFINHSKWNRNIYNNFAIEYAVYNDHSVNTEFTRVDNSQITWEAELSTKIQVRFYYLSVQYDKENSKDARGSEVVNYNYNSKATKILFTEFILDFDHLNDNLPFRSSFDYSFNFAMVKNCLQSRKQGTDNQNGTVLNITPDKMNNGVIPNKSSDEIPPLIVRIVEGKQGEKEINPYLQRSNFRFQLE